MENKLRIQINRDNEEPMILITDQLEFTNGTLKLKYVDDLDTNIKLDSDIKIGGNIISIKITLCENSKDTRMRIKAINGDVIAVSEITISGNPAYKNAILYVPIEGERNTIISTSILIDTEVIHALESEDDITVIIDWAHSCATTHMVKSVNFGSTYLSMVFSNGPDKHYPITNNILSISASPKDHPNITTDYFLFGTVGPQGMPGPKGDMGEPGPQGIPGPRGGDINGTK